MKGVRQPFVLIDFDCGELPVGQDAKRCDFAFVSDDGNWALAIELKSGNLDVSEVLPQLRAGAKLIEQILSESSRVQFLPVAVVGGKIRRTERDKLRRRSSRVAFRDKLESVKVLRCGSSLVGVLGSDVPEVN